MPVGAAIDDRLNVYVTSSTSGLHKLSPTGEQLWNLPCNSSSSPVLFNGSVYFTIKSGIMAAVGMETGKFVWTRQLGVPVGGDNHGVGVHMGVFIAPTDGKATGGMRKLTALRTSDGSFLWEFVGHSQLWNFMPFFMNDSVVFQDQIGGVYRLRVSDGQLLWKSGYSGGWEETWTDGTAMLGPNGIVYAVHCKGPLSSLSAHLPGDLRAYRFSDGELLWHTDVPYPPNSQPLVINSAGRLAVVMPMGAQATVPWTLPVLFLAVMGGACGCGVGSCRTRCKRPRRRVIKAMLLGTALAWFFGYFRMPPVMKERAFPAELRAYEAQTGAELWRWHLPLHTAQACAGDLEALPFRWGVGLQPLCLPTPFGSASADADGRIYVSYMNGRAYSLADTNGDGAIDDETEVESVDIFAASNIPGVALAPGMAVFPTCDAVIVFKDDDHQNQG